MEGRLFGKILEKLPLSDRPYSEKSLGVRMLGDMTFGNRLLDGNPLRRVGWVLNGVITNHGVNKNGRHIQFAAVSSIFGLVL